MIAARVARALAFRGAVVALPTLAGCGHAPRPGAPAPAPPDPTEEAYVSNLTGFAFGNAFARATADGAPATDDRSAGRDGAAEAAASKDGEELQRSCGNQGAQSHAQATAAFRPLPVAGVRQFGFALSASAYAKGGAWRGRLVLCRGTHATLAAADASATGRLDLMFNANGGPSDQLIVRIAGATPQEAHLEVRDAQNRSLPLSPVPGQSWVTTTLAEPGPYSVRASIAARARNAGGGQAHDQEGLHFSVSVQSRRDALALGYGDGPGPGDAVVLPLPVFMSTDAMSAALDSIVFADDHRFYPCARVACGTERLRDVYLELPRVTTKDGAVVLDMRLSGSYQLALIFGGGVSGSIRATAVPVVERDTLRFEAASIDVATHNLIVKWGSGGFEQKLLERIRTVRIDLAPQLQAAVARAQDRLADLWGGACLLLAPREAHLRSVQVVTAAPQGVVANFGLELSPASGRACLKRKAGP